MLSTLRILLVEDDEVDILLFRDALEEMSLHVPLHLCSNGEEALDWLESNFQPGEPLLIVTDLNMPRMNGLEFLQELRQHPNYQQIPTFVYTTSSSERDLEAAYAIGISGFVTKPHGGEASKDFVHLLSHYLQLVSFPI